MDGRKRLFTQTLRGRNISKIDGHGARKSYDGTSQNCGEVQSQSRADDSATLLVVENAVDKAVIPNKIYREGHLVADLGWVYKDFECSTTLLCCYANTARFSSVPVESG